MSILAAFMVPHPPMIVPEIGNGSEKQVTDTTLAYDRVADEVTALEPDTLIITSPHAVMYADYFHISPGKAAAGSFRQFRAPGVRFSEQYDTELVNRICALSDEAGFPAGTLGEREAALDHGTMVPLWFIRKKYAGGKIVRIGLSGLPLTDHYRLSPGPWRIPGRGRCSSQVGTFPTNSRNTGPMGSPRKGLNTIGGSWMSAVGRPSRSCSTLTKRFAIKQRNAAIGPS